MHYYQQSFYVYADPSTTSAFCLSIPPFAAYIKETTPQEKSPSKSKEKIEAQKDKTPLKKAWNVHGENLSAMRRSANKYTVLDLYDENGLVELQELRNSDRVEGGNSNMNKVKNRVEVDDVFDDDSGIAECMKNDGVNGMDGNVLNDI
nr:zinc knuckle CX2CX4HX4C [Tanacetum cinerariifolium]